MKIGAKRVLPRSAPRSRVGRPRDLEVLRSLAWAGYLSTEQVRRLHFPSTRTAQRRLRALLDHGLARAHLQGAALHLENVWTLTPTGAARLEATGSTNVRAGRAPRLQKLAHGLAIRDVFVAFVLAERAGVFTLEDFRFDGDLATEPLFQAARIVPDCLAILEKGGSAAVIGCEVDLGSETTATLRVKFSAWEGLLARGALGGARLLVAVRDESRGRTVECVLREVGCPASVVLLSDPLAMPASTLADLCAWAVRAERTGVGEEVEGFQGVAGGTPTAFRVS